MNRRGVARVVGPVVAVVLVGATGCAGEAGGDAGPTARVTVTRTVSPTPAGEPSESAPADDVTSSGRPERPVRLARAPRTYRAALAHLAAAGEAVEYSRFETPSGNIYCVLDEAGTPPGCELADGAIRDLAVCGRGGATRFVGRVELDRGRAVPACNTDTIRTPGPPVLAYGVATTRPGTDVVCLSERIGVTCLDRSSEQGFFLHREEYHVFSAR